MNKKQRKLKICLFFNFSSRNFDSQSRIRLQILQEFEAAKFSILDEQIEILTAFIYPNFDFITAFRWSIQDLVGKWNYRRVFRKGVCNTMFSLIISLVKVHSITTFFFSLKYVNKDYFYSWVPNKRVYSIIILALFPPYSISIFALFSPYSISKFSIQLFSSPYLFFRAYLFKKFA